MLHPQKSQSSRTSTVATQDPDFKAELKDLTTKLVALGIPWSELWVIHGAWIIATPNKKQPVSQIQFLTSKMSHICQEICDIKSMRKPKSNSLSHNYTSTLLDKGWKDQTSTQEPNSSSFAMEDNNDGDGLGDTYSSHSTQYHHEPNNLDIPSHHAPIPPSPSPVLSESILEPPGDLSPSPASRIVTETPSLLAKLEKKACSTALSSSVHTSPSGPCATWNVLLLTRNGLGEELLEELGMMED